MSYDQNSDPVVKIQEIRRGFEELLDKESQVVAARIDELVAVYGSLRKLGKAIKVDHAYLHRLKKGDKRMPSDKVLRKLGLA